MKTENRFSPGPAAWRNQATLRHPERSTYRCFLTDLAGFIDVCRAGPDYANRQDRKKTGLFHSNSSLERCHYTPVEEICQEKFSDNRCSSAGLQSADEQRLSEIFADQEAI